MSRVAKYRRQVSEDPDIDNLLSTLSPEEMEELQRELDAGDPDAGVSAGLRRDQTERASCQREAEKEKKRLAQKPTETAKVSEKIKEKKGNKVEEPNKESVKQDQSRPKKLEEKKDTKIQSSDIKKDDRVSKMRERFRQEKNSTMVEKEKNERFSSRKPSEEKSEKPTENETKELKTEKEVKETKKETKDKVSEKKPTPETSTKIKEKTEVQQSDQRVTGKKILDNVSMTNLQCLHDEPLMENVKNNDPEVTELNLNNSDCITIETLMSFTEALEFNTVVKIFSLANTRADDHIALAIAAMLKSNKTITSINLDSNHITGKGILAIFRALQHNDTLAELRFHNQRHICGGKTEMEIAKMLKENTTLLKLGYHFELAGPRMTVTNLLSRNMDKQRQRRLAEQRASQAIDNKKMNSLEVPKSNPIQKMTPKPSRQSSPINSLKRTTKREGAPVPPPPPPPLAPLAPPLINENIKNSLSPASQRRIVEKTGPAEKNSRDQLLESIRSSNVKQLKKVIIYCLVYLVAK
ncbi:hypothetical protein GDO86_003527 [Hymenochirus boettgeri]|uniref:Leiomodin-1 n=1 Tax=Hymenochirus boettgeri TaxID=247094 RepID=A0A8T2K418_9PIPI|nr:hypothetical protein GDO86_003527 [Hymenochirus boettgeri]